MPEAIELTILLPCLNEAETVGICIDKAFASLRRLAVVGEVLVADNGSTDGSQQIAAQHGALVVTAATPGYGAALMTGIEAARGELVIMADADDSYDLTQLDGFLQALRDGHDLVMGNRFAGGVEPGAMPFLHRYLGNPVLSALGRRLFPLSIHDFHCGLRGFSRSKIRGLDLCMSGMEFASEMLVRAGIAQLDVVEVPTTLHPDGRRTGHRHLRTWHDGWRHLRFLLVFAPRQTLLYPGALVTVAGLVGTAMLASGPMDVDGIVFDVSALVYACLALLVGTQLLLLGGTAKLYGSIEGLVSPREFSLWRRVMSLDAGAAVGTGLVALGLFGTLRALSSWRSAGFGPLDARATIRLVVPSATSIAIGILVVSFGLVGSLLTIRRPHGTRGTANDDDERRDERSAVPVSDPSVRS